jgi:hypothetical protein
MSESKRPRLRAETRSYTIDEPELCEWLTGAEEPRFYIKEVWIQPTGSIEFTVTTEKQAEVPVVRRAGAPNDRRVAEIRPDGAVDRYVDEGPSGATGLTDDEGYDGPALEEEGVGKPDPTPMIAPRSQTGKARLKTRRELQLEARATGRPEPVSHINHREDDDPVPSALPQ